MPNNNNRNNAQEIFTIPLCDDMHVHLRQDDLMGLVTPLVRPGGCDRIVVMPNLSPPISTCSDARTYRDKLTLLDPGVDYRMTLYLNPALTPAELNKHLEGSGVTGVKSYPKGVTTNSEAGIESYEPHYPLFREMEKLGLTLHLHGEVPHASPFEAEQRFLVEFDKITSAFPQLRVVLEHTTSCEAVECVKRKTGPVGATITAHHLDLTSTDVLKAGYSRSTSHEELPNYVTHPHFYCKPIAKTEKDRDALREVVEQGHPRFFLGSDSAPHLLSSKIRQPPPAGCFTSPLVVGYIADTFLGLNILNQEAISNFCTHHASAFFGLPRKEVTERSSCILIDPKGSIKVPDIYPLTATSEPDSPDTPIDGVVPYRAGNLLACGVTVKLSPMSGT
eukprot:GHVN01075592.1.p1 GENE.GHVN01075592.1~~GHVN01075592.1.p1  ORF type:complete len:391 (+),score=70.10 GHVN01075592.1:1160-2332(+)